MLDLKVTKEPSEIGFYSGLVVRSSPEILFKSKHPLLGLELLSRTMFYYTSMGTNVCLFLSFLLDTDRRICRSDRVGRRPIILSGLVGPGLSIFLFGMSQNLAWALISRSIGEPKSYITTEQRLMRLQLGQPLEM